MDLSSGISRLKASFLASQRVRRPLQTSVVGEEVGTELSRTALLSPRLLVLCAVVNLRPKLRPRFFTA